MPRASHHDDDPDACEDFDPDWRSVFEEEPVPADDDAGLPPRAAWPRPTPPAPRPTPPEPGS